MTLSLGRKCVLNVEHSLLLAIPRNSLDVQKGEAVYPDRHTRSTYTPHRLDSFATFPRARPRLAAAAARRDPAVQAVQRQIERRNVLVRQLELRLCVPRLAVARFRTVYKQAWDLRPTDAEMGAEAGVAQRGVPARREEVGGVEHARAGEALPAEAKSPELVSCWQPVGKACNPSS